MPDRPDRRWRNVLIGSGLVPLLAVVLALVPGGCVADTGDEPAGEPLTPPPLDQAFFDHWGDGHAELAGYELTFPRYGELRRGTAVAIFVTEQFVDSLRVKADPGRHDPADLFPVMKLNLIEDFPTGVYDYNVMTSTFVAMAPRHGRDLGHPTKVSFSSQEWCGHVWQQALFDERAIRFTMHSYFDGEADAREQLGYPRHGVSEDALLLWARQMAAPRLEPGESIEVPLLRSLKRARLRHVPVEWRNAVLTRSEATESIDVPAGTFEVDRFTCEVPGEYTWTFYVERAFPHRLVRWTRTDGIDAVMLGSDRMKYWQHNDPDGKKMLERLGIGE